MDDPRFQEKIRREMQARQIAREILGVKEHASAEDLKRAWRSQCIKYHPDRNAGDKDAPRKFAAMNCAYNLLAHGKPCEMLLRAENAKSRAPKHDKYNLDNAWGLFLWWREKYF